MIPWQQALETEPSLSALEQGWERIPVAAQRLQGGTTNTCWRVRTQCGHDFVWRPQTTTSDLLTASRCNEYHALTAVKKAPFAPKVERLLLPHGLLVTWLEGEALAPNSAMDTQTILMTALSQLHQYSQTLSSSDTSELSGFDFQQSVDYYRQRLDFSQSILADIREEVFAELERFGHISTELSQQTRKLAEPCLCHFDIGLYNLVKAQDGLKIIDWEYAALSYPVIDLAFCIANSGLTGGENFQASSDFIQSSVEKYASLRGLANITQWQQVTASWLPRVRLIAKLWYLLAYQQTGLLEYLVSAQKIRLIS